MVPSIAYEQRVYRQVFKSNPFYLISACCMLGGCLAMTNSLSWWGIPLIRLVMLILVLNIYEAALLGLAWYLIRKRRLLRDGMTLLVLEAAFLVDVTFLNLEISTASVKWGMVANVILLAAAAIKLAIALRLLDFKEVGRTLALLMATLTMSAALPTFFNWIGAGYVSAGWFYLAWWIAGALLAAYAVLWPKIMHEGSRVTFPVMAYISLPLLSLAAHIGNLHYVYDQPFWGACAAPILLGLMLVFDRVAKVQKLFRFDVMIFRILLPIAAVALSANNPAKLCYSSHYFGQFLVTPTKLILVAAYLACVFSFFARYWIAMLLAGATGASAAIFGPTLDQSVSFFDSMWSACGRYVSMLIPRTAMQWGCAAIAASFAFLGIGAAVSLRNGRTIAENDVTGSSGSE